MKITLIGAGSSQFGLGMISDIILSEPLSGAEICLMDINPAALDATAKRGSAYIDQKGLPYKITSTTDRRAAVSGADFIIISIEVGNRFELWDMDWTVPQQFGVRQVYGENGGPGGLFHALRIIPPILDICGDIMELSPEAYVFCYSNPMTAITTAVKRKFPELRFTGMCHEIASIERYLPVILETPVENIVYRAAGLNHFSVLTSVQYRDSGKDAYGDVMRKAPVLFQKEPGFSELLKYYEQTGKIYYTEGVQDRVILDSGIPVRPWGDRYLFRYIMENFGLFPITLDSHLGEYIPWAQSVADHKGILDFYSYYQLMLEHASEVEFSDEIHERVVYIMGGIVGGTEYEEPAVNIMNDGYIPGLPKDVAVEVPAVISSGGISGVDFPDYPRGFAALLRNYCGVYDLTAQAVLEKSRDLVIQALLVNPVVQDAVPIPELVDHMLDRQKKWLGYIE